MCLRNLLGLFGDVSVIPTLGFLSATWEYFAYDYIDRSPDGMRRVGQFLRPSGDIAEIRRLELARNPPGGII